MFHLAEVTGFDCGGEEVLKVIKFVFQLLDVVLFIIPMILIVMVIVDFTKNVIASKEDDMKKNLNLAIKRIIYCMALFLINPVVSAAIGLLGEIGVDAMACIDIAKTHDLSQYKIDNTIDYNGSAADFSNPSGIVPSTVPNSDGDEETNSQGNSNGYFILINPSHQIANHTTSTNRDYATEKQSMYILAEKLKAKLVEKGYGVYLTPSSGSIDSGDGCWNQSDSFGPPPNWSTCGAKQVKAAINEHNTDKTLYIALHSNASNGRAIGPYVYYANGKVGSLEFARELCTSLTKVYRNNGFSAGLGSAENCAQTSNNVSEPGKYYDNSGKGEAVLIEIGFHDNTTNQRFIEEHPGKLVNGMVKGIKKYIESKN